MIRALCFFALTLLITGTAFAQTMPTMGPTPTPADPPSTEPVIDPIGEGPPPPPEEGQLPSPETPNAANPAPLLPLPELPEQLPADPPDCKVEVDTCGATFSAADFDVEKVKHNAQFKVQHVSKKEVAPNGEFTCFRKTKSGRALVNGRIEMKSVWSEELKLWTHQKVKTVTVKSCTHILYQATSRESVATTKASWSLPSYSRPEYLAHPGYGFDLTIKWFDLKAPPGAPQTLTKEVKVGYLLNASPSLVSDKALWDYSVNIQNFGFLSDDTAERYESWRADIGMALLKSGKICPNFDGVTLENKTFLLPKPDTPRFNILEYERMTSFEPLECEPFEGDLSVAKNTISTLVAGTKLDQTTWLKKGEHHVEETIAYTGTMKPPWSETIEYAYLLNGVLQARLVLLESIMGALYAKDRLIPAVPLVPTGKKLDSAFRYPLRTDVS